MSWATASGLAGYAAARVIAVDRFPRAFPRATTAAVQSLAFTPQAAAVAPWAALGLRLARRQRPAATAAVAAVALGVLVRSRGVQRKQPEAGGPRLRVLTVNLYFGKADPEAVVARVRRSEADVLFLQELTADAVTRLKQAGLGDFMPHSRTDLRGGSRGSGIYSRLPLRDGPAMPASHMAQPSALAELPGGDRAELICVHPVTPMRRNGGASRWGAELAALPAPGGLPRIVAGDFNATLDHAAFRGVLRRGYVDAGLQAGKGLVPTWGLPGRSAVLTLDHVLASRGSAVLDYRVHVVPGSDHRAVFAEIRLPAR